MDPVARTFEVYEAKGAKYRLLATHEGTTRVRLNLFPDLEIDLGRIWV